MIFGRKKRLKLPGPQWPSRRSETDAGFVYSLVIAGLAIIIVILLRRCTRYRIQVEEVKTDDAADLYEQEQENPDFVILDVRSPSEFERGHIAIAINISYRSETFRSELGKLDKEKVYLTYSGHGARGRKAANIMKELGFGNVFHLAEGFGEWERMGHPTAR